MNLRIVIAACALIILVVCGAATVVADGRVTIANPNPIDTWKITDLRFAHISGNEPSAIVTVGYFRTDGTQDHTVEHSVSGPEYASLLAAIPTPSGADEATITTPDGSPDLSAIFRLRISRWMLARGKIEGVTAERVE